MSIKISLHHRTQYVYDKPVALGPQTIQLRPTPHCKTPILSYALTVTPPDHRLYWQLDPHANYLARVIFPDKATELTVDVDLLADLTPINPFDFLLEPGYATFPFRYPPELAKDLEPFRTALPATPQLRTFLQTSDRTPQNTVSFLIALNAHVRDTVGYVTRMEHGVQTPDQTLALRTGSCRDSAWLLVQTLRHLGLAARFVSGYLIQLAEDDTKPGAKPDNADLHAWAEVFLPGAGWIGLDATSGLFTAEGHIPLVCTPTAAQAAPIGGTVEPAGVQFSHTMQVRRLDQSPSFAKPYSDAEWQRIRDVAHAVDRDLHAQDVRLTMGGEPTYVGIDEPESLQWNLEALGDLKRERGLALIRRLRERTAPGGLLHFGQGKWYPGEPLPRWAFHCISRNDLIPIWENPDLIAHPDRAYNFAPADALPFLTALTHRLEVTAADILPAFNPFMDDDAQPIGFILPLRRRQPDGLLRWSSQPWFPRPDRLILSQGDSPIGYRIPVAAMPFVAPDELSYDRDPDGTIQLPTAPARRPDLFNQQPTPDPLPPSPPNPELAPELIRPFLCVQVREGRMHVFLPYIPIIADYLDLVAAIEDTCARLETPIWIEGYTPPVDPRIRAFSLTPDPGVLEVNLPPTSTWDELETLNQLLFEEALQNRLIAGKFAYDGTHLATGGGSHIVLGGATVPDSPLLRRPDLLRSMVAFWQNHPSLAYLFSGMYVGPTSQYPRVDEARADALYELELAFSQLPPTGEACPPYILDGLFRNLLVDATGNTHRAEFCIDKMYPPEGLGLRAGLLELRAFEMAPHVRMGLLQMLLIRALVAHLWRQPFQGPLIRWGTALHDRFMLPEFVRRDFAEVLAATGLPLQPEWFAPHYEFKFPKIGSVTAQGVVLELRQALEPWNVLAEETTSGRTGRSVDSSLERIQIKLSGLTESQTARYVVSCNNRRVPLGPIGSPIGNVPVGNGPTGTPGEAVAGIRYRARRLSAALHPTIPVHTPLAFELIDTWQQRAIAQCTYFAAPPDGTVFTTRPADAAEATRRRLQRFVVGTPTPGPIQPPPEEHNPIFPITLDLRFLPPVQ